MISRIPSWTVAVAGGVIVIVATATFSLMLYRISENVEKARSEITDEQRKIDELRSIDLQANQSDAIVAIFMAEALTTAVIDLRSYLIVRGAERLQKAALSMGEAMDYYQTEARFMGELEALTFKMKTSCIKALNECPEAYSTLVSVVQELRLGLAAHIRTLSSSIHSRKSRIETLEEQRSLIYLSYVFFNMFGLIITMCKDLPVWSDLKARGRT